SSTPRRRWRSWSGSSASPCAPASAPHPRRPAPEAPPAPGRATARAAVRRGPSPALGGRRPSAGGLQRLVLAAGVLPVLELDDAHLGELLAEPAVAGVQQAELLAVGHDLREQHLLEHAAAQVLDDERQDLLGLDAHAL